jgi:hypothetical protein
MRKPGLRELSDIIDGRRDAVAAFLPSWWTEAERKQVAESETGRAIARSVCGVIYEELCRIEAE